MSDRTDHYRLPPEVRNICPRCGGRAHDPYPVSGIEMGRHLDPAFNPCTRCHGLGYVREPEILIPPPLATDDG
jgi:hypothetical protein